MGRIVDSYTNILTVKLFARAARRGQLRARRGRSPRRCLSRGAATADGVRHRAQHPQRAVDRRRRRDRAGAVAAWRSRGRRHRHGAAADAPTHQHVAPDRRADHRPVRGDRHRAGRHDDDRAPAAACRSAPMPRHSMCGKASIVFDEVRFGYGREIGRAGRLHRSPCVPARRSASSAAPAPASRPWSTCCCGSSISKAAAS